MISNLVLYVEFSEAIELKLKEKNT